MSSAVPQEDRRGSTLEDPVYEASGPAEHVRYARPVREKSTLLREFPPTVHRRQPVLRREVNDPAAVGKGEAMREGDERVRAVMNGCGELPLEVVGVSHR